MSNVPATYMRRQDVIARYALTNRLLSSWQKRRLLPYTKIGRRTTLFKIEDIESFLNKYTVKMH